jgi:nucleotide sugar dehydrogenase
VKVAVLGCGYVGLVSAVGLATGGHDVVGIDSDEERLRLLEAGTPPFEEPGLADALAAVRSNGRFRVSSSTTAAAEADVVLLCVQTPPSYGGAVELRFVAEATEALAHALAAGAPRRRVVAIRSTVPPGTNRQVVAPRLAGVADLAVASNPEFLREGSALEDFLRADRVVLGVAEPWGADVMRRLYAPLGAPVVVVGNPATAELAKYASNALLATLVSFSNEIAHICESLPGVDVEDVLGILHADRRLTPPAEERPEILAYLKAGCGFGGSCLPKDVAALTAHAAAGGERLALLEAVAAVNGAQAARLVERAESELGGLDGRRIAVLGAAFKAGTDDLRDSPALRVIEELARRNAAVVVYDPLVARERLAGLNDGGVEVAGSLAEATDGADAVIVTTQAPEFRGLEGLVAQMNGTGPLVVDGRRALDPDAFAGGRYLGVGRGNPA